MSERGEGGGREKGEERELGGRDDGKVELKGQRREVEGGDRDEVGEESHRPPTLHNTHTHTHTHTHTLSFRARYGWQDDISRPLCDCQRTSHPQLHHKHCRRVRGGESVRMIRNFTLGKENRGLCV